jgi:hypothetical protein
MTATNEEIIAEAKRRWGKAPAIQMPIMEDFIIEVTREGWTPPPPVDPDVELAMTIARSKHSELADVRAVEATAASVLAGIKAGREQEQERAKVLVEYASAMVSGFFLLSDYRERASAALAAYKAGKAAR